MLTRRSIPLMPMGGILTSCLATRPLPVRTAISPTWRMGWVALSGRVRQRIACTTSLSGHQSQVNSGKPSLQVQRRSRARPQSGSGLAPAKKLLKQAASCGIPRSPTIHGRFWSTTAPSGLCWMQERLQGTFRVRLRTSGRFAKGHVAHWSTCPRQFGQTPRSFQRVKCTSILRIRIISTPLSVSA